MKRRDFFILIALLSISVAGGLQVRTSAAGIFVVTNVNDSGVGSLRQAILDANGNPGTDVINFNIGSGLQTITLTSALPVISDPVIIDGTTQPGFSGAPLIELSAGAIPSLPNQAVLRITSGDTTIRSLIINHFQDSGISLSTGGGNHIEGNYVGLDATGSLATNSRGNGISIQCPNNIIGGTTAHSGNVISGTDSNAISIFGGGNGTQILGNYIGTNAAGTSGVANFAGIFLGTSNNTIGGTTAAARNVIAAGDYAGIVMQENGTSGNVIQGNYIGTDATGMINLGFTNYGIAIFNSSNSNTIGGTAPGAGNVLSGNGWGLSIAASNGTPSGNVVQGNLIGVAADGTTPLPNRVKGVLLTNALNTTVGGDVAGAKNIVAFNGPAGDIGMGTGVDVLQGSGNVIRGNSIFSNGRLGIDLDSNGVTSNDNGDDDSGGNGLQNFPVISSVTTNATQTTISGTLNSKGSTSFTIDFYANSACDPAGYGEGARFIGSSTATTDANGVASFNAVFAPIAANQVVTATATDPSGNTSEFSQCAPGSSAAGSVSFITTTVAVSESVGMASIPLSRIGGSTGSLTIGYRVSGITATAGTDFIASQGTITFADGEISKSIEVPIVDDNVYESAPETVKIALSATGNPDTLGSQNVAILTINDDDPFPTSSIGDVAAAEGNSGTTNFVFPITLSNPSSQPITIQVSTSNNTARLGTDFLAPASDTVIIPAGQTSATITIPVIGDTVGEGDEIFFVNVVASTVLVLDGQGRGTIANDDGPATAMTVFGRVTEFSGVPVPNVTITLTINRMGVIETQTTQTDANGLYASNSFACGNNVTVSPSLSGRKFSPTSIGFVNTCGDQIADFKAVPAVVISQLYTAGGETGATYLNDYVELLNRGGSPINVSGWSVQYAVANGTTWQTTSFPNLTLQPGQRLLIREGSDGSTGAVVPTPDRTGLIHMSSSGGKVALVGTTIPLPAGPCPLSSFVADFIGYGATADCFEGASAAPAPTVTTAAIRSGDGCVDTDNNGVDFALGSPNPRNRFSPLTPCGSTIQFSVSSFNVGEADTSSVITVNRTGDTSGTSTVDFASSNGTANQLRDYEVANGTLTFTAGQASKTFKVFIVDDVFVEGNETVNLTLSNPTGATLIAPSTATVTIVDNDTAGTTSPVAKQFVANLTGADEVPATGNTVKGNGGIVQLSTDELSAKVSLIFSGLTGSETGAHIHGPALTGANAPIIFPLPLGNPLLNEVINPTAPQVADLKGGLHYMNVHSSSFTNGEIRGQLQWNPAEEADFFVRQAYFDFLGRTPDAGGFAFWTSEITNCQSDVQCLRNKRVDVSNAFFYELEFQQTAAYVLRLYRGAYGNTQPSPVPSMSNPTEGNKIPSYTVFVADRARVIGSTNLAQKQLDVANLFVTRPEFLARYPASLATADQFVDAVLATLLNDLGLNLSGQRTNLINLYNTQGGRGAVLYRLADDNAATNPIANQPFIDAEYNRTFVLGQYFGYLRRNPDIAGFLFWLGQVNGAPLRDVTRQHAMVCSFITASEYQLRFGPTVSRNNNECPQ